MSTLPIDLQILVTKANERSENVAKQSQFDQNVIQQGVEKAHQASLEADTKVKAMDEYSEDNTKINQDQQKKEKQQSKKRTEKDKSVLPQTVENYKPAELEEGTGTIIDIID